MVAFPGPTERLPMEALLHELVRRVRRTNPADPSAQGLGTPIFDVEMDGLRVLVVPVAQKPGAPARLSPRERDVVCLVAGGATNRKIADQLGISTWTVATYLRRIFTKLDVTSRAAMVSVIAYREESVDE